MDKDKDYLLQIFNDIKECLNKNDLTQEEWWDCFAKLGYLQEQLNKQEI